MQRQKKKKDPERKKTDTLIMSEALLPIKRRVMGPPGRRKPSRYRGSHAQGGIHEGVQTQSKELLTNETSSGSSSYFYYYCVLM
jgi:hypothetical protein